MTIAIVNHKGGTGKTTTAINIGRALVNQHQKVLLVDLDPQGNLSYSLSVPVEEAQLVDVLLNKAGYQEVLKQREGMDVLPSNKELAKAESKLSAEDNSRFLLRKALQKMEQYDYILIDCPPSYSLLTFNALNAADGVLVPIELDVLSLQGVKQILNTIKEVKEQENEGLSLFGVLAVKVDERKKLTYEVLEFLKDNFHVPVFNNYIRTNVRAAEAPSFGQSVIEYAPESNSAKDYITASRELMTILQN